MDASRRQVLTATTQDHPFVFHVGHDAHRVSYLPAESDTGTFGENANWRWRKGDSRSASPRNRRTGGRP
jgi:hypothetical protein